MLFKTEFTIRNATEESLPRQLEVFAAWQPPEGMDIQGFFFHADGSGGFSIAEVPDAATALRALAPFAPWLDFDLVPIMPVEEGAAIAAEAVAFRAGVSS